MLNGNRLSKPENRRLKTAKAIELESEDRKLSNRSEKFPLKKESEEEDEIARKDEYPASNDEEEEDITHVPVHNFTPGLAIRRNSHASAIDEVAFVPDFAHGLANKKRNSHRRGFHSGSGVAHGLANKKRNSHRRGFHFGSGALQSRGYGTQPSSETTTVIEEIEKVERLKREVVDEESTLIVEPLIVEHLMVEPLTVEPLKVEMVELTTAQPNSQNTDKIIRRRNVREQFLTCKSHRWSVECEMRGERDRLQWM